MEESRIAKNIKQAITESGLKQYVVAERAGYSTRKLSDMLNGRKIIEAVDIPKIAKVLNVTANDLLSAEREGA